MSDDFDLQAPNLPPAPMRKLGRALAQLRDTLGDLGFPIPKDPFEPGPGPDDAPLVTPPITPPLGRDFHDLVDLINDIEFRLPSPIEIIDTEMTQSVQFFNFDGQSSGAGADNSIPLFAGKALVLRVFFFQREGMTLRAPTRVTGEVRIGGKTIAANNGPLALRPRSALRRARPDDSLNFLIPGELCRAGLRNIRVVLFDPDEEWKKRIFVTGYPIPTGIAETYTVRFHPMPPMRLSGLLLGYNGPNAPGADFNIPAPTPQAFVDTVLRLLPMFPIHGFDFAPCRMDRVSSDLRIVSGLPKSGWDLTLKTMAEIRSASTIRTYLVGLLPAGLSATIGTSQLGIGGGGCALAAQDNTRALTHELGHAMNLMHLDDGVSGNAPPYDAAYPNYGMFPFTSIGEFGLDTSRMDLFDPNTDRDFMGYSDPADVMFPASTWISPYHYLKAREEILNTDGTGDAPGTVVAPGPFLVATLRVHRDDSVELLSAYRVTRVRPLRGRPSAVDLLLELLDGEGRILGSQPCRAFNYLHTVGGPFIDVHEVLPWPDGVRALSVRRAGREIAVLKPEGRTPKVSLGRMRRLQKASDLAHLDWSVEGGAETVQAMVRYSNDDGCSWTALKTGLTEAAFAADLDLLPGGEACRFEVIVSAGLDSTTVQTDRFAVPTKPRKAWLVSPADGTVARAGTPVVFAGAGYSPDGGVCANNEVAWVSSLQGHLGQGPHLVRADLAPGLHRITLTVPDRAHGEARDAVWLRIVEDDGCGPEDGVD